MKDNDSDRMKNNRGMMWLSIAVLLLTALPTSSAAAWCDAPPEPGLPRKFVVLGQTRTGSTLLMSALDLSPAVATGNELFIPRWGLPMERLRQRGVTPTEYMDAWYGAAARATGARVAGFKLFPMWQMTWRHLAPAVLDDPTVGVVLLYRATVLDGFVSAAKAQEYGGWQNRTNDSSRQALAVDAPRFLDWAATRSRAYARVAAHLVAAGHVASGRASLVTYESIAGELELLHLAVCQILKSLCVPPADWPSLAALDALRHNMTKAAKAPLHHSVQNYMEAWSSELTYASRNFVDDPIPPKGIETVPP